MIDGIKIQIKVDDPKQLIESINSNNGEMMVRASTSTGAINEYPKTGKLQPPWKNDNVSASLDLKIHKQRGDILLDVRGSFANFKNGRFPDRNISFTANEFQEVSSHLSGTYQTLRMGQ